MVYIYSNLNLQIVQRKYILNEDFNGNNDFERFYEVETFDIEANIADLENLIFLLM